MRKAIVTGATGFIGSWLVEELVSHNVEVTAIVRDSSNFRTLSNDYNVKTITYDTVSLENCLNQVERDYDAFYDLRWGGVAPEQKNDIQIQLDNIRGSTEMLELSKKMGCKLFVGIGTCAEYTHSNGMINENQAPTPSDVYGGAKVAAHYLCKMLAKRLNQPFIWAILPSTFGERRLDFSQDTYTGCNTCTFLDEVYYLNLPINIVGASGRSMGGRMSHNNESTVKITHAGSMNNNILKEISRVGRMDGQMMRLCGFFSDEIVNAENILMSVEKKLLPKEWIDKINWKRYFEMCLSYVYVDDSDEHFKAKMEDIREKVELRGDPEIIEWFYSGYYNNKGFKGSPVPSSAPFTNGLLPNGALYLDGRDFDIHNVYDAAVFFEKIANFKTGFTYPPTDW